MNKEKFYKLIKEREFEASDIRQDANYDEINRICNELTEILSENITETIEFLKTECSAKNFIWISEIFDEIVEKTQSKEFIDCLYFLAEKYPKETKEYYILNCIDYAVDYLDEDYERKKKYDSNEYYNLIDKNLKNKGGK